MVWMDCCESFSDSNFLSNESFLKPTIADFVDEDVGEMRGEVRKGEKSVERFKKNQRKNIE